MKFRSREESRVGYKIHENVEVNEPSGDIINVKEVADKWIDMFLVDIKRAATGDPPLRPLFYAELLDRLIDVDAEAFARLPKPENGLEYFRGQLLEDPFIFSNISNTVSILVRMYPKAKAEIEQIYDRAISSFYRTRRFERDQAPEIVLRAVQLLFLQPYNQQRIKEIAAPAVRLVFAETLNGKGFYAPPNQYGYFKDLLLLDPSLRPAIQAYVKKHAAEARKSLRNAEQLHDGVVIFGILTDFNVIQADEAEVLPDGELKLTKKNRFTPAAPTPLPARPTF